MKIISLLKNKNFIFVFLFLIICLIYNYAYIFALRPGAIHQWRQTDCLSFVQNYYEGGVRFFEPSINYIGENGNGKTVSEFPILYYIVALLWKIFGKHEFLFRLLNFSIAFLGLFYLFKLARVVLKKNFWAIILPMILFTSPLFVYYTNNFLSNIPAFSLTFPGWFYFYKFYTKEKNKYLYVSMFFFMMAGLLKVSSAISFFTLFIVYFIELFHIFTLKKDKKIFFKPLLHVIPFILVLAIISLWYLFAFHYNEINNGGFFLQGILPIWEIGGEKIKLILFNLYNDLLPQFFSKFLLDLALILFVVMLIFYKRVNKLFFVIMISLFGAVICYLILFFQVFDVHDYYLIDLLIFPVAIFFTFLVFLKENFEGILNSKIFKVSIVIVLTFNIYYCAVNNRMKYNSNDFLAKNSFLFTKTQIDLWNWTRWHYGCTIKACETITPYLRSIGIQRSDYVISIPDRSLNISLYLMDQVGNTDLFYEPAYGEQNIRKFIKRGAKYLIINDPDLLTQDYVKPFIKKKIGQYKNVTIYDLRNFDK